MHSLAHGLLDAFGRDGVLIVISFLNLATFIGNINGALHTVGHPISVHQHPAVNVTGGSTYGLNQGTIIAQEALLVRIQNCY